MIPIVQQPEPASFATRVRDPGSDFLRRNPTATPKKIKEKNYWSRCLPDLRNSYSQVCAYSACWIPSDGSVDHFIPVTVRPDLAYEWTNYRLASQKINSYKSHHTTVLDPFHIQSGWFVINFQNLFVEAGDVTQQIKSAVEQTIMILKLNNDELVQQRLNIVTDYKAGDVSFRFLQKRYPFIAYELKRQGIR